MRAGEDGEHHGGEINQAHTGENADRGLHAAGCSVEGFAHVEDHVQFGSPMPSAIMYGRNKRDDPNLFVRCCLFSNATSPTKPMSRLPRNATQDRGLVAPVSSTASCIRSKNR